MKNDDWGSGYQGRSREHMESLGEGVGLIFKITIGVAIVAAILFVLQLASSL